MPQRAVIGVCHILVSSWEKSVGLWMRCRPPDVFERLAFLCTLQYRGMTQRHVCVVVWNEVKPTQAQCRRHWMSPPQDQSSLSFSAAKKVDFVTPRSHPAANTHREWSPRLLQLEQLAERNKPMSLNAVKTELGETLTLRRNRPSRWAIPSLLSLAGQQNLGEILLGR